MLKRWFFVSFFPWCCCALLVMIQSGCQIDSADSDDPNQQREKIIIEIPADTTIDLYRVTIVTLTGDTTAIYYETAKGNRILVAVPSQDSSIVTIVAFSENKQVGTGSASVPPGHSGLTKLSLQQHQVVLAAAPSALNASLTENNHVSLTWTPGAGALGYTIYRSTDPALPPAAIAKTEQCELVDNTAIPDATYYYRVTAWNTAGESEPTVYVSIAIHSKSTPPPVPQNIQAAPASPTSITVTWSASAGATGYTVYSGTTAAALSPIGTVTETAFTHIGLTAGATYFYTVAATNENGTSDRSSVASATTNAIPVPGKPESVTAIAMSSSSITITVAPVEGATEYLFFAGTSASSLTPLCTLTTTSYTHSGLTATTTYYYAATALNKSGASARSNTVNATTASPQLPSTPTDVTAAVSQVSITVSWKTVTGAVNYIVYSGTSASALSPVDTVTSPGYTRTDCTPGTVYYFAVAASNANGTSGRSAVVSAALQPKAPDVPGNVSATAASSAITVKWATVTGATTYIVYRGTSSSSLSPICTTATTTFSDTGLKAATTYYYAVATSNSGGTSARSTTVNATTQAAAPAIPTGVTATAESATSIIIKWNAVTGATQYIVYGGTNSSSLSQVATVTTTTRTQTGLTAATTYYYAVAASNAGGTSARSATVSTVTKTAAVAKSYINLGACPQGRCNRCRPCPKGAISASYVVDPAKCVGKAACGQCFSKCPHGAISYKLY